MLDAQRTVGRFEIQKEIGRGGMGVVYLARQRDLDRKVALKELGSFHAADPTFAERFIRESRVAGSLNHPNIVTVYEYFEHGGTPYIAMEYIDRGSLRAWMPRLSIAQVVGVFEGVLAGLAHAAKHGIVHRDLKPENLLVTDEGTIKIGDFGIAKALNQASIGPLLTATGTTVGTPTYMAPEQAMGREIGPWTDLYSVGVMAYEILVGRVPFDDADTPMVILMRHVNEAIPSPRSVKPELDPELGAWIERLLVKAPDDRIRTPHRAWDELEEIVIGMLGPRWRREARLVEPVAPGVATHEQPLTPAPFEAKPEDGFETFQPAQAGRQAAAPAEPEPPEQAPASDSFVTYSAAPPATPPAPPVEAPPSPPPEAAPPPPEAPPPAPVEPVEPEPIPAAVAPPIAPEAPPPSAETLPPEPHVAGAGTSFNWPISERRTRKRLLLGLAAVVAVASVIAGAVAFVGFGGSGDEASSKPPTPTVTVPDDPPPLAPPPLPPPGPTARSTSVEETSTAIVATIRFGGRPLGRKSLAVRDADLTDGSATVLIAQPRIASAIGASELAGLAFRPRAAANRLTVTLSSLPRRFTKVEARRSANGRTVVLRATRFVAPPPPPPRPAPPPPPPLEERPPPTPPAPTPICRDKLGRPIPCR